MIHANGQWKTKKALREAAMPIPCEASVERNFEGAAICIVHKRPIGHDASTCRLGRGVNVDAFTNPSIFGDPSVPDNGRFAVVGPSAYARKWYATVETKDGKVIKVS